MKKYIAALAALSLALPGMAQAQGQSNQREQQREQQRDQGQHPENHGAQVSRAAHQFRQGERFERAKASNYRRIAYTENRRLTRPRTGQVWVRAGGDALLVRLSDNVVLQVVGGLF